MCTFPYYCQCYILYFIVYHFDEKNEISSIFSLHLSSYKYLFTNVKLSLEITVFHSL